MIGGIEVSADGTLTADLSADAAAKVAAPTLDTQPQDESLKGLADKLKELAGKLGDADGDLAAKLSALAEKLGAVKTTAAELLEDAPELKAVIDALVQPKAEAKTTLPARFRSARTALAGKSFPVGEEDGGAGAAGCTSAGR